MHVLDNKEELADSVFDEAKKLNKELFGQYLDLYGISYISDVCDNMCLYCGLNSGIRTPRQKLTPEEMRKDFTAILKHRPDELCILAGESIGNCDLYIEALEVLAEVDNDLGNPLDLVTLNIAPLSTEDFKRIADAHRNARMKVGRHIPLQFRMFQELYDREEYGRVHKKGPKSNYDFRRSAQTRALDAGFDQVGIGVLLGLHRGGGERHLGHDQEIISLIEHAFEIERLGGKAPYSLSLLRHQPVAGYHFATPNPVDDERYVLYHALIRIALPETRLMITSRETPEMIRRLEPIINIRDLAPRPGVGGNFRTDSRFQNKVSDLRDAEEILQDLRVRKKIRDRMN